MLHSAQAKFVVSRDRGAKGGQRGKSVISPGSDTSDISGIKGIEAAEAYVPGSCREMQNWKANRWSLNRQETMTRHLHAIRACYTAGRGGLGERPEMPTEPQKGLRLCVARSPDVIVEVRRRVVNCVGFVLIGGGILCCCGGVRDFVGCFGWCATRRGGGLFVGVCGCGWVGGLRFCGGACKFSSCCFAGRRPVVRPVACGCGRGLRTQERVLCYFTSHLILPAGRGPCLCGAGAGRP